MAANIPHNNCVLEYVCVALLRAPSALHCARFHLLDFVTSMFFKPQFQDCSVDNVIGLFGSEAV